MIEDKSSNGTLINGERIPGVDNRLKIAKVGDIVTVGENKPEINLVLEYEEKPKKFDTVEATALLNQLEKCEMSREKLDETGLARELRLWKDSKEIKKKVPEIAEFASEIFAKWKDDYTRNSSTEDPSSSNAKVGGTKSTKAKSNSKSNATKRTNQENEAPNGTTATAAKRRKKR